MKVPKGFEIENNVVCKLNKALYGLKQAPKAWNKTFNNFIMHLGFRRSEINKCLYILEVKEVCVYILLRGVIKK